VKNGVVDCQSIIKQGEGAEYPGRILYCVTPVTGIQH
jgi:hypothetical protein